MSSSFVVRVADPPDVASVIRALDRPGVRWADGDLASLGTWPERSLLLWIPGVSSRGVEVVRDGSTLRIRLLVLSTSGDYDLAFRLVEVLGGSSLVDVEADEPTPADRVRVRFGDAWMTRDMAAGIAGLRAALETGSAVTVSGPARTLDIEPATLRTTELARLPEILRDAQRDERDDHDEPDDDHLALAVILAGNQVHAYHGRIGTRARDLLARGPAAIVDAARTLPVARDVRYPALEAGWLADLDRRVLHVVLGHRDSPLELPAWQGFAIEHHDDADAIAAYLGRRGLALPIAPSTDDDPAWAACRDTIDPGLAEHVAKLAAEQRADPAPRRAPNGSWGSTVTALALFVVVVVPALVIRLVTIPLRGWLRVRRRRTRERQQREERARVLAAHARVVATPDEVDALHDRALAFLQSGDWAAADRDLERCLARLDHGATAQITRGAVLHNLSIARQKLRLPALAERATRASADAGFVVRRSPMHVVRVHAWAIRDLFVGLAGLAPD